MVYRCIKDFLLDECDADGFSIENEDMIVKAESIWEMEEYPNDIVLNRVDKHECIEIDEETLEHYFEIVK